MSNKSTQIALNTNSVKQNLKGKTVDYTKNLAEFRNAISYIAAQIKSGKDNPLTIKACQNLIRTISALDLPADVKRHELAVAPSGVQKLYQQITQSKSAKSSISQTKQEALQNAIQQSLQDKIANLHNMTKTERQEFYKSIMTPERLQEALKNGFEINEEYAEEFLKKCEEDLNQLKILRERKIELEEKIKNNTATIDDRRELAQVNERLPRTENTVTQNRQTATIIARNGNSLSSQTRIEISKQLDESTQDRNLRGDAHSQIRSALRSQDSFQKIRSKINETQNSRIGAENSGHQGTGRNPLTNMQSDSQARQPSSNNEFSWLINKTVTPSHNSTEQNTTVQNGSVSTVTDTKEIKINNVSDNKKTSSVKSANKKESSLANTDNTTDSQTNKTEQQYENNEEQQSSSLMNRLTAASRNQAPQTNSVAYSR